MAQRRDRRLLRAAQFRRPGRLIAARLGRGQLRLEELDLLVLGAQELDLHAHLLQQQLHPQPLRSGRLGAQGLVLHGNVRPIKRRHVCRRSALRGRRRPDFLKWRRFWRRRYRRLHD